MPQSDGYNRLKRFEFVMGRQSFRFNLNPEEYSQDEPSRSTVTPTKGGAWIDDFGGGLEIIFMRGSTGLKNGFTKFKALRKLIRNYRDSTEPGNSPSEELVFHNFTDEESWIVHLDPAGFKLFRSKTNPLMYMYELRLVCLRKASQPEIEQKTEVIVDRDEFQRNAEMDRLTSQYGTGNSRVGISRGGSTSAVNIPSRLADSAGSIGGAATIVGGIAPRGYLQAFSQPSAVYESIKPHLDLRLSPLGMHYLTHIHHNTYTPTGEFTEGTLGHVVFNQLYSYDLWDKYGDTFNYVMLDLYALTDAYNNHYELFKSRFSKQDTNRLIENIRWLIDGLSNEDNIVDIEKTPILHHTTTTFRDVELVLSRMRKDPNLFDHNIAGDMENLNNARGVEDER